MAAKYEELTNTQKAAIALIAFGGDVSAEVLKGLNDNDLEKLTIEIANMRDVPSDIEDKVIEECHEIFMAREYISQGGIDYAREILEKAVGKTRATGLMNKLESSLITSGFNLLKSIDPKQLVQFIQNEHPQTISLILTQLTPNPSSAILSELPPELQSEVAIRIATMEKISPEIVKQIESTLEAHFATSAMRDLSVSGGAKAIADILNLVETSSE